MGGEAGTKFLELAGSLTRKNTVLLHVAFVRHLKPSSKNQPNKTPHSHTFKISLLKQPWFHYLSVGSKKRKICTLQTRL